MAAVVAPLAPPPMTRFHIDADSLSTLPDPRSPDAGGSPIGSGSSTPHPDLNTEVATLSNKLISAINHQTHLDDVLAAANQQLKEAHARIEKLEAEKYEHAQQIETGVLVKKEAMDEVLSRFVERDRRTQIAEQEKRRMELELENLTTTLFEEANQMVVEARKETKASEARNEQLRMQIRDTESILASQQEQLAELKNVMEQMQTRDERDGTDSTAPSSPALQMQPEFKQAMEAMQSGVSPSQEGVAPAPPTTFVNLISPVLRMDLTSYDDFRALAEISKRSASSSRLSSGTHSTGSMPGSISGFVAPPSGASQSSTPGSVTPQAFPGSPQMSPTMIPLKETRFYKRALSEDIEPTLRLDLAPGLSWLVRRSVASSIVEGSIAVEPMPSPTKIFIYPCSLCGENRREPAFQRAHRFRTSESDSKQRYPLCSYCLGRLRATCDYVGFLRMIKDGHWRTNSPEEEKAAWEESVRLRERMFWARIGGGVVPNFMYRDSSRPSSDEEKPHLPPRSPSQTQNSSIQTAGVDQKPLPTPQRNPELGGIDERLASYAIDRKNNEHSDTDSLANSQANGPTSETAADAGSSSSPQTSPRHVSHDKELPPNPETLTATTEQGESGDVNNDRGLQISIPGGFQ